MFEKAHVTPGTESVRITVLGGGSGIAQVLRGLTFLKKAGRPIDITAIVTVADDGGSSGRIRRERGCLPPGDIRNCLLALAEPDGSALRRLFAHRYDGDSGLGGHALGNLILAALAEQDGCFLKAVKEAERMLKSAGRVLPASLDCVQLQGVTRDGARLDGESRIGQAQTAMKHIWLNPADPEPAPGVLSSINESDLIILGPGSLFTSLLPVLMIPGIGEAVRKAGGKRVYVANIMTQPGETRGMNLLEHLEALDDHVGIGLVDEIVVPSRMPERIRMQPYEAAGAEPVGFEGIETHRSEKIIRSDIVTNQGKLRHHPVNLASLLLRPFSETGLPGSAGRCSDDSYPAITDEEPGRRTRQGIVNR